MEKGIVNFKTVPAAPSGETGLNRMIQKMIQTNTRFGITDSEGSLVKRETHMKTDGSPRQLT